MHFLIIGGGIAGTTAAEELHAREPKAEITLITEEYHPLYSRVLLPHYIKGKIPRERCFLKKELWYDEQNIEWLAGVRVMSIDVKNAFVTLSDGREFPYDKLLLATGGEPRPLAEDRRGVSQFRTMDDADHLLQLMREMPAGARAVVNGGGFIACEYIDIFKQFEIPTTVIHRGPHFWSRTLDADSGALIRQRLEANRFDVVAGATVTDLKGEEELTAVVTEKGTIPCSLLAVGTGLEADVTTVKEADIGTGKGILVNEYMETNASNVYAAGDVVEYFDVTVGRQRMAGTWQNAMTQGKIAARNMAGAHEAFRLVSSFSAHVLGLDIIFIGDTDRSAADRVVVEGSAKEGGVAQRFYRSNKLVGATLVNRNTDRAAITKEIMG